jgi:sec-independent protein translocase protein TatC
MDEKKTPFATYLQEIRRRLILSFIGVGVGFLICYGFFDSIFNILAAPLIRIMPVESTLIFRSVADGWRM